MIDDVSRELAQTLTAGFDGFVRGRLAVLGVGVNDELEAALAHGGEWLADELNSELTKPYRDQGRGPLEIFQAAMSFPTEALRAGGLEPVLRDEVTAQALPGDAYGLAPASSRDLGEEAWSAHLTWGASKAAAFLKG